jgi:hypothetical protein
LCDSWFILPLGGEHAPNNDPIFHLDRRRAVTSAAKSTSLCVTAQRVFGFE